MLLSLITALFVTFVQFSDLLVEDWAPKYDQPAPVTLRVPSGSSLVEGGTEHSPPTRITHSRIIVPWGEVLRRGSEEDRMAMAYDAMRRPLGAFRAVGVFVVFFTLCLAVTSYLRSFGQNRLRLLRVQIGVFVMISMAVLVSKAFLLFTALPAYWLPVSAIPLWMAATFGRRSAFVIALVLAFLVASLARLDLLLLCTLLATGLAATVLHVDRRRSRFMVMSGIVGGLVAAVLYVAISGLVEGHFDFIHDLFPPIHSALIASVGGGLAAGVIAVILRGPATRLLGSVPRERLLDLTDLEQPLLQKMAREAPGTWEHCRAMANLAEQASSAIGADGLLTRVGAYYHDLGKTAQSKYFVENLLPDEASPHDDLDPDVSADAIMAHVVVGTKILREGGIPEPVVEFAYSHHGTQLVEYFWNKCQSQGNPKGLGSSAFRYPGMKPQTKETAILMLVDSIEAASRTIDPPVREQFEAMIQRIVFTKLKAGQLDESGLDIDELRILINRMSETLVNMNHHRVKYPWQRKRAEEFGVPSDAVGSPQVEIHGHAVAHLPPPSADRVSAPSGRPDSATLASPPSSSDNKEAAPTPGARLGDRGKVPETPSSGPPTSARRSGEKH